MTSTDQETFNFKDFPDFDNRIQSCVHDACFLIHDNRKDNTLFALEIHMEAPPNILTTLRRNEKKIEGKIAHLQRAYELFRSPMDTLPPDSKQFLTLQIKTLPTCKLHIQEQQLNLHNCLGFYTKNYNDHVSDKGYYHIFYLLQTNSKGKLNLLAILDKDNSLKWKNIDLKIENQIYLDTELPTTIPSDNYNLMFNIKDKNPNSPLTFGKINLLPTIHVSSSESQQYTAANAEFYPRDPKFPLMGSDAAKREIVSFKLKRVVDRMDYIQKCKDLLDETDGKKEAEYKKLQIKKSYWEENLDDLDEPAELEKLGPCIKMASDAIVAVRYEGIVAIQIACILSTKYWNKTFLKDRDNLIKTFSGYDRDIVKISKNMDLDTINGYRLDENAKDYSYYHTLLMQVIGGRLVLLAKMSKDATSSKALVSHNWKNFSFPDHPTIPNKKVLEKFNSLFKIRDHNDYAFSIGIDPNIYDYKKAFIGRTSALPQIFIEKQFAGHILFRGGQTPTYLTQKSYITQESFIIETLTMEINYLKLALAEYTFKNELKNQEKTMDRIRHIQEYLLSLKTSLRGGKRLRSTSPLPRNLASTTQLFQSLNI